MLTREQVIERANIVHDGGLCSIALEWSTTDAALRAEVEEVTLRRSETIAMCDQLRAEIDRLRGERTDDQLHTDNIELRVRCEAAERTRDTANKYIARIMKLEECIRDDQTSHPLNVLSHTGVSFVEKAVKWYQQQLATMTQERDTAMRVSNAFLEGGVTEELLRRHDGHIKLAKGCCIVIEEEWSNLLRRLAERVALVKELEKARDQQAHNASCVLALQRQLDVAKGNLPNNHVV